MAPETRTVSDHHGRVRRVLGRARPFSRADVHFLRRLRRDYFASVSASSAAARPLHRRAELSRIQLHHDPQPDWLAGRRGALRPDQHGPADRRADRSTSLARRCGTQDRRTSRIHIRRLATQPLPVILDPVAAYDLIAPVFSRIAEKRRAYLESIDRLVISEIPPGSRSMLDVGSGDGARARRIAETRGIGKLILIEPSVAMQRGPATTMR